MREAAGWILVRWRPGTLHSLHEALSPGLPLCLCKPFSPMGTCGTWWGYDHARRSEDAFYVLGYLLPATIQT